MKSGKKQIVNQMIKDGVYEAVMDIIREDSDKLTMDEVAGRVGVSKGTLYNYFKNKEDLMECVDQQTMEPIIEALAKIRQMNVSAAEKLMETAKFIVSIFTEKKDYFDYQKNLLTFKQSLEKHRATAYHHTLSICAEGILNGEFDEFDPVYLNAFVSGNINQVMHDWIYEGKSDPNTHKLLEQMELFFRKGFIRNNKRKEKE
jgi:AcrR family transcriptional regulator